MHWGHSADDFRPDLWAAACACLLGGQSTTTLPGACKGASLRKLINLCVLGSTRKRGLFEIKLPRKPNWVKLNRDIKRRADFSLRNQSGWYLFLLF